MRFVRKPKPLTRGRNAARFGRTGGLNWGLNWNLNWPTLPPLWRVQQARRRWQAGRNEKPLTLPRVLSALSWLGAVMCVLVAGSALFNQFGREAQFQNLAAHISTLGAAP